jgi:hypothetical protein
MPVTIEHGIKRLGNCVATMPERTLRQEAAVFAVEIDLVLPVRIIGQPFEKVIEISISQACVYSPDSGRWEWGVKRAYVLRFKQPKLNISHRWVFQQHARNGLRNFESSCSTA